MTPPREAGGEVLNVRGAVQEAIALSWANAGDYPEFSIPNMPLIAERERPEAPERVAGVASYRGILLRDVLLRAGFTFKRTWEPGVWITVRGAGRSVVFSFGEVIYSSAGRGILIATERNGERLRFAEGFGELVVATDARDGRRIPGVTEVAVERVPVELTAYQDAAQNVVRPPASSIAIASARTGTQVAVGLDELLNMVDCFSSLGRLPCAATAVHRETRPCATV